MKNYFLGVALVLVTQCGWGQSRTVGLITHDAGSLDSGYVLFAPVSSTTTYLIDKCGKLVHAWPSKYVPHESVYLLPDGSLLRPGLYPDNFNNGGMIERIDWDGTVRWHFLVADSINPQHHDICPLPNGNLLVITSDVHFAQDTYDAGRDTNVDGSMTSSESIVEYRPVGTDSAVVVWKWRAWDHLVQERDPAVSNYGSVALHPELIDLNYIVGSTADWIHLNSVTYNAALDEIMVSSHQFSEIWIIDHATTTTEAASHSGGKRGKGGDLLYRWGNPQAYNQGTSANQQLFSQHDATWVPDNYPHAGGILVFNNGFGRPGRYSSVDLIFPPVDVAGNYPGDVPYGPTAQAWIYTDSPPSNFMSPAIGGASLLSNGNILVCSGSSGRFFEADSLKQKVWEYINPVISSGPVAQGDSSRGNGAFRCSYYPWSYLVGREPRGGAPLEASPTPYDCALNVDTSSGVIEPAARGPNALALFPNPAIDHVTIALEDEPDDARVVDAVGAVVADVRHSRHLPIDALPNGVYTIVVHRGSACSRQLLTICR